MVNLHYSRVGLKEVVCTNIKLIYLKFYSKSRLAKCFKFHLIFYQVNNIIFSYVIFTLHSHIHYLLFLFHYAFIIITDQEFFLIWFGWFMCTENLHYESPNFKMQMNQTCCIRQIKILKSLNINFINLL